VQFFAIGNFALFRRGLLRDLAEMTGGRVFEDYKIENTAEFIWNELRNQYALAYKSSNNKRDGKWRKVKVVVRPPRGLPKLYVNAKSGYLAPE
jgi:VWFA-related protein